MSNFVEFDIDFDACGEVEKVIVHDECGEHEARLKVIVHDECGEHEDVEFYRDGLLAEENANLRELVREMFRDFVNCDLQLREHGRTFLAYTRYNDRLRELGIEVDE